LGEEIEREEKTERVEGVDGWGDGGSKLGAEGVARSKRDEKWEGGKRKGGRGQQ